MIEYNLGKKVNFEHLVQLFNQAGWTDKTSDLDRLQLMVENSQIVVTAWDEGNMIGFARCVTDHVFNGQINNVIVDQEYRGRGIGKRLMINILNSSKMVTYILRGDPDNVDFYKHMGFKDVNLSLVYNRVE